MLGDFNARALDWDSTFNRRGPALQKWARAHNVSTQRPPHPTLINNTGQSRVDLCFHRSRVPPSITVLGRTRMSDHASVMATLTTGRPELISSIPLYLFSNEKFCARIRDIYNKSIPPIVAKVDGATTYKSLEQALTDLIIECARPRNMFSPQKPHRFRAGWTRDLDNKAKERTKLWKSGDPAKITKARQLDIVIKKTFKENVRLLRKQLGDELNGSDQSSQFQVMKRALSLSHHIKPMLCPTVNPARFTEFMDSLQPLPEDAPVVPLLSFSVPDSFETEVERVIRVGIKKHKAPGPDKIRLEILQIQPRLFAKVCVEIWRAVGRLCFVPSVLRTGTLSPIYKQQVDPSEPSNHRPICLISVFRKVIASALTREIGNHYTPNDCQWGFRCESGTECGIAFAVNLLRRELPMAVLLDLKKAYDLVPRSKLQVMIDKALPSNLAKNIRPLLWPMRLTTKYQVGGKVLETWSGVPQGDPPSPQLFLIFMDSYLVTVNPRPNKSLATLFVDDVLGLARSLVSLLKFLGMSVQWADEHDMIWAVAKSCGLDLPGQATLNGKPLENVNEATYLGVTLNRRGVTARKLCERIEAGRKMLMKLRRTTKRWTTTLEQRRLFVKTFVYSVVDYVLYLQPSTPEVLEKGKALDQLCLVYVLGTPLNPKQATRGRCVTRLLSLRARRRRHLVQMLCRFRAKIIQSNRTERDLENWETLATYSTVWAFVGCVKLPKTVDELTSWKHEQLRMVAAVDWSGGNTHRRKIPRGLRLPPVFRGNLSPRAERTAVKWYLNRIPWTQQLSDLKEELHHLLAKDFLPAAELETVEQLLYDVI